MHIAINSVDNSLLINQTQTLDTGQVDTTFVYTASKHTPHALSKTILHQTNVTFVTPNIYHILHLFLLNNQIIIHFNSIYHPIIAG